VARAVAISAAEHQDVADSAARAEALKACIAAADFGRARALCITEAEEARVTKAEAEEAARTDGKGRASPDSARKLWLSPPAQTPGSTRKDLDSP